MNIRKLCMGGVLLASAALSHGWQAAPAKVANDAVRNYIAQRKADIAKEFEDFLSIPNLASDTQNIQKNADALAAMLQMRGLQVQLPGNSRRSETKLHHR